MGEMTGNSEIIQHEPDNLFIGNNDFESGKLSLAASGSAKDGYLLVRNADGNYEVATAVTAGAMFVLATRDTITNSSTTAAATFTARVCVSGKVKRSAVTLNGAALTDAQVDMLRASGIVAQNVHSIGVSDNE